MKKTGSLIIGYDFDDGKDKSVLIVGTKNIGEYCNVINAFEGKEAEDIYNLLTEKKEEVKKNG